MPRSTKISEFKKGARAELAKLANDNAPPHAAEAIKVLMAVVLTANGRPALAGAGDRLLHQGELNALRALIDWQADQFGVFSRLIVLAVEIAFDADNLAQLRARDFDAVMSYVVHLRSDGAAPAAATAAQEQHQ
jgi:hypothetical protein